jgi:NADH-quinone oxidoreductase subunit C
MNERLAQLLRGKFGDAIEETAEFRGDLSVTVSKERLRDICLFLRDDPGLAYVMVIDVLGVDRDRPEGRFEVVYIISSNSTRHTMRLKVKVEEEDLSVPTVTGVWCGAEWHEREVYDMFGISFTGHPDLRRLYMPEEYEHFPLRKDFPLMGIPDSLPLPRR